MVKEDWQERLLETIGPGLLPGVTVSNWISILRQARFEIGLKYWPRAMLISGISLLNSIGACVEKLIFQRKIMRQSIQSPVFILGCWRSGTTFLQNLLAKDLRFGSPNLYQTLFPSHFLYTEPLLSRLIGTLVPATRPQDNVSLSMRQPSEEEIAMCAFSATSHLIGDTMTGRGIDHYRSFITLETLEHGEREKWKKHYQYLLKKFTVRHQKPLILKSPANTGRIRTLLEMFPDAKFIMVHRHPYDVIRSGMHWIRKVRRYWKLTEIKNGNIETTLLQNYRLVMNSYFANRNLIPAKNLKEIDFNSLECNPVECVREVYHDLKLPDFSEAKSEIENYVGRLKNYTKNLPHSLADDLKTRIFSACPRAFEVWDYAVDETTTEVAAHPNRADEAAA